MGKNMFNEVKRTVKITDIVAKYGYQMDRNNKILCPFHEEKTPSCSINAEKNRFKCFACGVGGSVIDFVALKENILPKEAVDKLCREYGITTQTPPIQQQQNKKRIGSREHIYTDEQGNILAKKEVIKFSDSSKQCYWNKYDTTKGKYIKGGLHGLQIPLYHVDRLRNADIVYIAEGEKDVETLEKMGYIATTQPHGANTTWKTDYNKYLQDKKCIILTDNDDSGNKAGTKTAESLTKSGVPCKLIKATDIYKDIKQKGDITDIFEAVGIEKALDLLRIAVNNTSDYTPISTEPIETEQEKTRENPYNFDGTGKFSLVNLKCYLKKNNISVKYNDITHDMEIEYKRCSSELHAIETAPTYIYDDLKNYISGCNENRIANYLFVISTENRYNPVLDAINRVKWDGKSRIEEIYKLFGIPEQDGLSRILFKKWLFQCYCMLFNDNLNTAFSPETVLVLVGTQGIGKTSFFKKLSIFPQYFGEGKSVDTHDKDSKIEALSTWICELGEIGSTMKKDLDSLKAFLSSSKDEFRRPYGRNYVKYPRITSFCGTTNNMDFLIDETGNRRFATIPLKHDLSIPYLDIQKFDVLQLWAEVKSKVETEIKVLHKNYDNVFRLSEQEKAQLNERNKEHTKQLKGEQEVIDILDKQMMNSYALKPMTATDFKEAFPVLQKYSSQQVGKVLEKLGYQKNSKTIRVNNATMKNYYNLPIRIDSNNSNGLNPYNNNNNY